MKWDRAELARTGATLGVALLIAGYVYYVRQGGLLLPAKILLITGGVFLLAATVLGFRGILGFFSLRSSQLGTNTMILSLAVIAILGVLNFAGARHPKRFDLTTEKLYTLSDQTKRVVGGLQNDVTILRFDKTADPALDDLMVEYKNLSPHLKFQNVDPQKKPEVAKEYGVRLVAITALGSQLAAMADVLLPLKSLETDFIFKPSSSRYAMMMVLDVLMAELALLQKDHSHEDVMLFVADYYRQHASEFKRPETVTLRQILVTTPNEARDVQRRLLKQPKNFETLARTSSRGPEAPEGGLMGTFARGQLPPELETAAFGLPVGGMSEIVETTLGYHVLRVEAREAAHQESLEEAQGRIRALLSRQKSDQRIRQFVSELLAQAKVNHAAADRPSGPS